MFGDSTMVGSQMMKDFLYSLIAVNTKRDMPRVMRLELQFHITDCNKKKKKLIRKVKKNSKEKGEVGKRQEQLPCK